MKHPNATVSGGSSIVTLLVVWLLDRLGFSMPAEAGVAIAGCVSTLLLWIGRHGLRGVWRTIVNGTGGRQG